MNRRRLGAGMLATGLLALKGDTMRTADLAPLLQPEPPPGVGFRKGVVVAWNTTTASNIIRVDGVDFTDVPILASSAEVVQMRPGDVVGLHVVGSGAFATMYVVGRITIPGSPDAADAVAAFLAIASGRITASVASGSSTRNSTSYGDLAAGAGPSVTATIGASGKALVFWHVDMSWGSVNDQGGQTSVAVSGATTVAASDSWSSGWGMDTNSATLYATRDQGNGMHLFEGLNPGSNTFTVKYRCVFAGQTLTWQQRECVVFAL